jgi:hypothetical protein
MEGKDNFNFSCSLAGGVRREKSVRQKAKGKGWGGTKEIEGERFEEE